MTLHSRYKIVRKIADGGTAEIFLAKQHGAQGFEKTVVLKRIFPTFYADPQFRHMLVDEAHIAMSLNHSNIVQVLDLGEAEGRYFLALELVDGWTLDGVLRRAKNAGIPFPPPLALYVTAEVCRALAYAHGKAREGTPLGIVHRDVSPHNILISEQGEVKLADFGIAKAQNKREQTLGSVIKGKIAFMSPEQASGTELDARSDLFSLGTLLYVMITRRYPFDAPTDFETLMQVRSGDFLPPETARPGLNPELYRVIRKAMGKLASDRYQKAEEMLVDVEQVMRLAFRPVGQTELVRWLAELAEKDGAVPLTRDANAPVLTSGPGESGIVLDVHDAELLGDVSGAAAPTTIDRPVQPPPVPPASTADASSTSITNLRPPSRRKLVIAGAVALAAMIIVAAVAAIRGPATDSARTSPVDADTTAATAALSPPPLATPPSPVGTIADAPAEAAAVAQAPPTDAAPPGGEAPEKLEPASDKPIAKNQVALTVNSEPDGATVFMRREEVGTTPLTLRLKRGSAYELTFNKTGYVSTIKRGRVASRPLALKATLKKTPAPKATVKPSAKPPAAKQAAKPTTAKPISKKLGTASSKPSKPADARRPGFFTR